MTTLNRMHTAVLSALLASIALTTVLAACASPAGRSGSAGSAGVPSTRGDSSTSASTGTSASAPRRGGYYMDDGPLDQAAPDPTTVADAVPKLEPLIARANRPYTVFGRGYQPITSLRPYRERGIASWYGRKFHGNRTSSGEVYDMFAMTAAHPTLPLPSYVRVTRIGTEQSVVVRVNDRGPFLNNRVIDLSYTAANKLGYVNAGSTEVEIELIVEAQLLATAAPTVAASTAASPAAVVLAPVAVRPATSIQPLIVPMELKSIAATADDKPVVTTSATATATSTATATEERLTIDTQIAADPPRAEPVPSAPIQSALIPSAQMPSAPIQSAPAAATRVIAFGSYLQLGAFSNRENALAAQSRLKILLPWLSVPIEIYPEAALFKVHAGPYNKRDDAAAAAEQIRAATGSRPFMTSHPNPK